MWHVPINNSFRLKNLDVKYALAGILCQITLKCILGFNQPTAVFTNKTDESLCTYQDWQ